MDRDTAVEQAISQIERQFGRGSIMKMGDQPTVDIPVISTGSLSLDIALGIGGVPRGRVLEIYGPESSGKTTLSLHIAAEAQAEGGMVAFIDAEHALDVGYARKLGVDVDELLVSQPDTGEQALDIVEILARSGAVDVLIIDSVAALTPRAEIEGEMGDHHVGLQARLMSQALQKTDCHRPQIHVYRHLYQPDQNEDRCNVREPGDDNRRECPEILRHTEAGYQAYRRNQGRGRSHREQDQGKGGKKQDRAPLQTGGI